MACSPPGSSVHEDSLGKNTRVGCHALLQGNRFLDDIYYAQKVTRIIQRSSVFCLFFPASPVVYLVNESESVSRVSQSLQPHNCSLPDSSVHGILQARILERVAIPFSRGSSRLRDWTWVSCIAGRFSTVWATREAQSSAFPPSLDVLGPLRLQSHCSLIRFHSCAIETRNRIPFHKLITSNSLVIILI